MPSHRKLIYLSASIIPSTSASSVHIIKMCHAFSKIGYETTLVIPKIDFRLDAANNIYKDYNTEPNFSITRLPFLFPKNSRLRYLLSTLLFCVLISFVLIIKRPRIVYGRYLPGCFVSSLIGIPTIYESHSKVWEHRLENYLFLKMVHFKQLINVIVISHALKGMYLTRTPQVKNKIRVAHDAADPIKDIKTVSHWPGRKTCLQIGYIGSIYRGRGMRLIDRISCQLPEMDFHIIGASIDEFKNAINRKPASNIYCHGRVPHSEISHYLNTCDILLAPFQKKVQIYGGGGNTVDFMSPLKIFEYMSSGKPIIVSDLPVLHEVLNKETAMFAEAEDIQAWVKAIQALEDPKIRKEIGQNAKTRFSKSYTWEKRALRVLGLN